jgi:hypothetical protein
LRHVGDDRRFGAEEPTETAEESLVQQDQVCRDKNGPHDERVQQHAEGQGEAELGESPE